MAKKTQSSRNTTLFLLFLFLAIFGVVIWYNVTNGTELGKDFLSEFTPIYSAVRNFFIGIAVRLGFR